jgi:formate dehydrogenase subunit delta
MSGSLGRLIYMANQIGRNLATEHDPATAVADHIARFWDPRMRAMIVDHLDGGGAGLDPLSIAALRRLREGQAS